MTVTNTEAGTLGFPFWRLGINCLRAATGIIMGAVLILLLNTTHIGAGAARLHTLFTSPVLILIAGACVLIEIGGSLVMTAYPVAGAQA